VLDAGYEEKQSQATLALLVLLWNRWEAPYTLGRTDATAHPAIHIPPQRGISVLDTASIHSSECT